MNLLNDTPATGHVITWGVPLLAAVAAAVIFLTGANPGLFSLINQSYQLTGDHPWAMLSVLADALVAAVLLLPLCGRRPDILWAFFIASLLTALWVHGFKSLLALPRPYAVLGPEAVHVVGKVLRNGSFPSGHTATAFLVAAIYAFMLRSRAWAAWLVLVATLAGLSRIAVGAHWPLDVAAGAFGGWLSVVLAFRLARRWPVGEGVMMQRTLSVILVLGALALLTVHDTHFDDGWWLQRVIALVCLLLAWPGLKRLWRTAPSNAGAA